MNKSFVCQSFFVASLAEGPGYNVFETLLRVNFQLIRLFVVDHGRRSTVFL